MRGNGGDKGKEVKEIAEESEIKGEKQSSEEKGGEKVQEGERS